MVFGSILSPDLHGHRAARRVLGQCARHVDIAEEVERAAEGIAIGRLVTEVELLCDRAPIEADISGRPMAAEGFQTAIKCTHQDAVVIAAHSGKLSRSNQRQSPARSPPPRRQRWRAGRHSSTGPGWQRARR